jgi:hypothetical protein
MMERSFRSISIPVLTLMTLLSPLSLQEIAAQTEEQFLPSEVKQLTVVTEPISLNKGFFRLGTVMMYAMVDRMFNEEGKKDYLTGSIWSKHWAYTLMGQYGITDRLEAGLAIPFVNTSTFSSFDYVLLYEDQQEDLTWDIKGRGLGDMEPYVRYQILTEKTTAPSLVGELSATLPTGRKNFKDVRDIFDYKEPTGNGELGLNLFLLARKIIYPYSFRIYGAYKYSFGGEKLFNATDTEELHFRSGPVLMVGGRADILLNDWISMMNEISFANTGRGEIENIPKDQLYHNWRIAYEGSLVFQIRQFRVAETVVVPLKGINISADPQYVLMVQYLF